jgi:hypothetical protein
MMWTLQSEALGEVTGPLMRLALPRIRASSEDDD